MGGLTRPGLYTPPGIDPQTGQPIAPELQYYKSPGARALDFAKQQSAQVQPTTSSVEGSIDGTPATGSILPPAPNVPQFIHPSFRQAATDPTTGMMGQINPAETKLGKLVHILAGAAQGALAGWGTGNPGAGAEMARQVPFQQAQQRGQIQLQQAEMQPIQTPYGTLPAALAPKLLSPYLQYAGKTESAKTAAGAGVAKAEIGAGAKVQAEQIGKRFIVVPGVGVYDTALTNEKQAPALLPGTSQSITITPELAKEYQLPDEFVGKPMKLTELAGIQRSSVFQNVPQMTAQGPIVVNRRTSQATPVVGPGGTTYSPPALASPYQVADLANPGQTKTVSGGQSITQGAPGPQSASVTVPRRAAEAEVPTKIGDLKLAFTTMAQHAELLRTAARALHNGDVQTLARLQNAFRNEFGTPGPITAAAIADAYKGEVSNVINKGHITDTGNEKIAHTLDPTKQNYATIDSVLGAYQALAQSKMNMLSKQEQDAIRKSQPGQANVQQQGDFFSQFGGQARQPGTQVAAPPK